MCEEHADLVCASCGAPATHSCYETGQFFVVFRFVMIANTQLLMMALMAILVFSELLHFQKV
jgi:hypothetical protein